MNKCSISFTVVLVTLITATAPADICKSCVHLSKCANFVNMGKEEQLSWMRKYPCNNQHPDDYGTRPGSSATQGDFICCPNEIWGVDQKGGHLSQITEDNRFGNPQDDQSQYPNNNYNKNKPSNVKGAGNDANTKVFTNNQKDSHSGTPNPRTSLEPSRWPNTNMYWNDRPDRNKWDIGNQIFYPGNNNPKLFNNRRNDYDNYQRDGRNYNYYDQDGRRNQPDDSLNYRGSERNYNDYLYYPNYPSNRRPGNSFGNPGQCDSLTSLPPDPQSGCCGREASDDDRITDAPNEYDYNAPTYNNNGWRREEDPPSYDYYSMYKDENNTLSINNNTETVVKGTKGDASTVSVENRISGGKETELSQYPWTALLLAIFENGLQQSGFNCGGSLISSRYVLTAGHCVYESESVLKSVKVFLAEYDKRTFPQDCKMTAEGQKCIENIALYSEDVVLHPRFDNKRLQNDIALVKLHKNAPYTEYIRPICLPSINIDNPEHTRLPLTVAGWGRNGLYRSDIKQSTTVHLVPQHDCKKSYPDLTKRHLCAAGYSGEDTCRGDSGGPLMVKYRGKYYVVGVVSGKRRDAPCGSSIPSLYTNVYHYLDWIRSNIRS